MRRLSAIVIALLLPCATLCFESLIQAQGELRKDRPVRPLQFAAPDWNLYHRTDRLLAALISTARSCQRFTANSHLIDTSQSFTPEQPPQSTPITTDSKLPTSGADGLLYFTIRSRPSPRFSLRPQPSPSTRTVFVFGEEGRDLLTSEISLRVLTKLCANETFAPPLPPEVELILIPVANPDGRTIAEMGRRCDRTNANDVEIDRNWPSFWRFEQDQHRESAKTKVSAIRAAVSRRFSRADAVSDDVISPITGTHPFSEPESRALRNLVFLLRPSSYVSIRTGAPAMVLPWDCKQGPLPPDKDKRMSQVIKSVSAAHCNRCKLGSLWNVTGAAKCGTSMDYMYGTMRVPFVSSWHVYDAAQAPHGDCFRKHNPTSRGAYDRITDNWASAVLNFSLAVHTWTMLETEQGLEVAEQNASLSAAEATVWRAQAIAKGMPDPESPDLDDAGLRAQSNSETSTEKIAKDADLNPVDENEHIKSSSRGPTENSPPLHRAEAAASDNNAKHKASEADDDEYRFGLLTGWTGAWASLGILCLALFIARRYFFANANKRYGFRSRGRRLPGKRA